MYASSTGIRTFSHGYSTLINTTLDLLFKKEARFGQPYVSLQTGDLDFISCTTSGTRIYWSLPCSDGNNYTFVSTFNPPLPSELRGGTYWRLLTETDVTSNPTCMVREDDGTIIFGSHAAISYVKSLENANTTVAVALRTQINYGQNLNPKQCGNIRLLINTGGAVFTYILYGLQENGSILTATGTISSNGLSTVNLDPHASLGFSLGFAISLTGSSAVFYLSYVIWEIVQEYPVITFFQSTLATNYGKPVPKKIASFPFEVDTLGNPISAEILADNVSLGVQSTITNAKSTEFWYNTKDIAAIDWELRLSSTLGMRFFKFISPVVLQVFPPGKLLDQLGPFDFDQKGLIFGIRLRVYTTVEPLTYIVYDADVMVYTNIITTIPNQDQAYLETFPKGINPSVCRILFSANVVFYRFSFEVKVRPTGKETEERWIAIN